MRFFLHRLLISTFVVVLSSVFLFGADLQAGKRAYEQKDYATATQELAPLAQEGNAEAELLLGKMYMSGQGVPKDPDLALKWFRAAADQGNAEGQFFLGAMYLLPAKDIPQGLKWLRLSAEQGMPDAQLLLGMAYLKGRDAPHDLVEADMWLQLAATQGDKFAPPNTNWPKNKYARTKSPRLERWQRRGSPGLHQAPSRYQKASVYSSLVHGE